MQSVGLKQLQEHAVKRLRNIFINLVSECQKYDNSLMFGTTRMVCSSSFCMLMTLDLDIAGEDLGDTKQVKTQLSTKFEIKDLEELHNFLGIEVIRTPDEILLTQKPLHTEPTLQVWHGGL
mgnify:CR=1 FL=1